jgi:1-acyl-sn-glycerol-3-phosphate acyltransferase
MKNFFEKAKIFDLKNVSDDVLLYRVMPRLLLTIVKKYLRLTVEGAENIPKKGRCLITLNHSGFSGFDAIILRNEIFTQTGRVPRVLTHHLWFLTKATSIPAQKLGFIEATMNNGIKYLNKNNAVVIFPEGEYGNFKPTTKRYRLQEFKRGAIRMALKTGSPIVPTLVIGAEETHINLKQIKFTKYLMGGVLPLPLNIIPLPAKWKIKFLPAIHLPFKPNAADDAELVHEIAIDLREKMQLEINKELSKRDFIFVGKKL